MLMKTAWLIYHPEGESDTTVKEFDIKKNIMGFFRRSGGNFISGEEISGALGFSRASTWKYIKKLREEGYIIDAIPHLGYRLKSSPDKLYGYDISIGLNTRNIGKGTIHHYNTAGSTNDIAYTLAENGEPEGSIVIAESQSGGKGRMGRKWVSPAREGIYMSIILRPDVNIDEIPAITLITAGAVIRAIKNVCEVDAGMKWPNDIFINNRKVCGILTEIKAQPDRVDFLVLGIGLNVNTPAGKLPPGATSLREESSERFNRHLLFKCMLEEIEEGYLAFKKKGFGPLRAECKEVSLSLGKRVKVSEHDRSTEGQAVDIDEKGALIIKTDSGDMRRIFSGDVTLCRGRTRS